MAKTLTSTNNLVNGSTFGPFSRYKLHLHESHRGQEFSCWMVLDAENPDELTGMPGVIRQAATIQEAVKGLPLTEEVTA